jgi:hypothetical protein
MWQPHNNDVEQDLRRQQEEQELRRQNQREQFERALRYQEQQNFAREQELRRQQDEEELQRRNQQELYKKALREQREEEEQLQHYKQMLKEKQEKFAHFHQETELGLIAVSTISSTAVQNHQHDKGIFMGAKTEEHVVHAGAVDADAIMSDPTAQSKRKHDESSKSKSIGTKKEKKKPSKRLTEMRARRAALERALGTAPSGAGDGTAGGGISVPTSNSAAPEEEIEYANFHDE